MEIEPNIEFNSRFEAKDSSVRFTIVTVAQRDL